MAIFVFWEVVFKKCITLYEIIVIEDKYNRKVAVKVFYLAQYSALK